MIHYVEFVPPVCGIEGSFNTFRLGLAYSKRLLVGDRVFLADTKAKAVIAEAAVEYLHVGPLEDMLQRHAFMNHAVRYEADNHSQKLYDILMKFYGPHIVTLKKKTTVIGLCMEKSV